MLPLARIAPMLVAAAVAACNPAATTPAPVPEGSTAVVEQDYAIMPGSVTIADGATLAVRNDGPSTHNLSIRDASGEVLVATKDLPSGGTQAISVRVPAGSYVLFCSIAGHEGLGMKGTLTVTR